MNPSGFGQEIEIKTKSGRLVKVNFSGFFNISDGFGNLAMGSVDNVPMLCDVINGHRQDIELAGTNPIAARYCPHKCAAIIGASIKPNLLLQDTEDAKVFMGKLLSDFKTWYEKNYTNLSARDLFISRATTNTGLLKNKGELDFTFFELVKMYNLEISNESLSQENLDRLVAQTPTKKLSKKS